MFFDSIMLAGNRFIIGQFQPGKSLIYRLDPRTKIILVFLIMLVTLLVTTIPFYALMILSLMTALILSRLGWRTIISGLTPIIWFILFTAIFHLIFSGHDDPHKLFRIGSLTISHRAAELAVTFSSRIVIFVLATFIVSLTTNPLSISEAIVSLLRPLRYLRIPVYDLGMILFIALRFIPVLANEIDAVRKAQKIRGIDFRGSLRQRIKKSLALVLPVFFSALRRADDLSVAIETRGYRSGYPRSSLYPLRFRVIDYAFLAAGVVFSVAVILGDAMA